MRGGDEVWEGEMDNAVGERSINGEWLRGGGGAWERTAKGGWKVGGERGKGEMNERAVSEV